MSVDGGSTLNVAIAVGVKWADPQMSLRCGQRTIMLPTRVVADLNGERRAEMSVVLAREKHVSTPLTVVVLGPDRWVLTIQDRISGRTRGVSLPLRLATAQRANSSWLLSGGPGQVVTLEAISSTPSAVIDGIAVGFTGVEVRGVFVDSARDVGLTVRHMGGAELEVPFSMSGGRFCGSLPLDEMADLDGRWDLLTVQSGEQRCARGRSAPDSRFALSTPISLVANGTRLLRFRSYTTAKGDIRFSITAIIEERT